MSLGTLPETRTLVSANGGAAPRRLVRVDASDLILGLFVAELDRPWMDTPFLIQGFVADSAIEITTLQRYCRHVFVDLERSVPQAAAALREAMEQGAPRGSLGGAPGSVRERGDATHAALPGRDSQWRHAAATGAASGAASGAATGATTGAASGAASRPGANQPAAIGDPAAASRTAEPGSPPHSADAHASARTAHRPSTRTYRIRADVSITAETRDRFRRLLLGERRGAPRNDSGSVGQRILGRLRSMIGGTADSSPDTVPMIDAALDDELTALSADAPGHAHAPRLPISQALPEARACTLALAAALDRAMGEVRERRPVSLECVAEAVERLVDAVLDSPDAIVWTAEAREGERSQAVRTAAMITCFGHQLGLPRDELHALGTIGLLADIGKALLPRALLEKPGMLNPAEYSIVKEHVRLGLEALALDRSLHPTVAAGIAQHHERLDGSGYPKGLHRPDIGLHGRMTAIVDAFSALCAPRAYANALAPQDALMSLFQWSESSFDLGLVEQLVYAIGVFPVGTLVELSTGEVGVVIAQDPMRRLSPRVLAISHPDKQPRTTPLEVPIERELGDSTIAVTTIMRGLPAGAHGLALPDRHPDESVGTSVQLPSD